MQERISRHKRKIRFREEIKNIIIAFFSIAYVCFSLFLFNYGIMIGDKSDTVIGLLLLLAFIVFAYDYYDRIRFEDTDYNIRMYDGRF